MCLNTRYTHQRCGCISYEQWPCKKVAEDPELDLGDCGAVIPDTSPVLLDGLCERCGAAGGGMLEERMAEGVVGDVGVGDFKDGDKERVRERLEKKIKEAEKMEEGFQRDKELCKWRYELQMAEAGWRYHARKKEIEGMVEGKEKKEEKMEESEKEWWMDVAVAGRECSSLRGEEFFLQEEGKLEREHFRRDRDPRGWEWN